jgi:hypothetical protein
MSSYHELMVRQANEHRASSAAPAMSPGAACEVSRYDPNQYLAARQEKTIAMRANNIRRCLTEAITLIASTVRTLRPVRSRG